MIRDTENILSILFTTKYVHFSSSRQPTMESYLANKSISWDAKFVPDRRYPWFINIEVSNAFLNYSSLDLPDLSHIPNISVLSIFV